MLNLDKADNEGAYDQLPVFYTQEGQDKTVLCLWRLTKDGRDRPTKRGAPALVPNRREGQGCLGPDRQASHRSGLPILHH